MKFNLANGEVNSRAFINATLLQFSGINIYRMTIARKHKNINPRSISIENPRHLPLHVRTDENLFLSMYYVNKFEINNRKNFTRE